MNSTILVDLFYYDYILYKIIEMYKENVPFSEILVYLEIATVYSKKFKEEKIVMDEELTVKELYIKCYQLLVLLNEGGMNFKKCNGDSYSYSSTDSSNGSSDDVSSYSSTDKILNNDITNLKVFKNNITITDISNTCNISNNNCYLKNKKSIEKELNNVKDTMQFLYFINKKYPNIIKRKDFKTIRNIIFCIYFVKINNIYKKGNFYLEFINNEASKDKKIHRILKNVNFEKFFKNLNSIRFKFPVMIEFTNMIKKRVEEDFKDKKGN